MASVLLFLRLCVGTIYRFWGLMQVVLRPRVFEKDLTLNLETMVEAGVGRANSQVTRSGVWAYSTGHCIVRGHRILVLVLEVGRRKKIPSSQHIEAWKDLPRKDGYMQYQPKHKSGFASAGFADLPTFQPTCGVVLAFGQTIPTVEASCSTLVCFSTILPNVEATSGSANSTA